MNAFKILTVILAITTIAAGAYLSVVMKEKTAIMAEKDMIVASYDEATTVLTDIQSSLDAINPESVKEIMKNTEVPANASLSERKASMMKSIADINAQIEGYRKQLDDLEKKFKSKNIKFDNLNKMVAQLQKTIEEKEAMIVELNAEIEKLNLTIQTERVEHKTAIASKDQTIAEKEEEIRNKQRAKYDIYYVIGTKKELLEKGLVEKKGGFLWFGKVTDMTKQYDTSLFVKMNLTDSDEIILPTVMEKVRVMSDQNTSTYALTNMSDTESVLKVTDLEAFAQNKYVVILVK
jgi:chromosome segregation ATPase